jgi:hypothetical protein
MLWWTQQQSGTLRVPQQQQNSHARCPLGPAEKVKRWFAANTNQQYHKSVNRQLENGKQVAEADLSVPASGVQGQLSRPPEASYSIHLRANYATKR